MRTSMALRKTFAARLTALAACQITYIYSDIHYLHIIVQRVKTSTSIWLKANAHFPDFRGWGREYAGFSYSLRDKNMIIGYIMKQKEHHRKKTFVEEYRAFLKENGATIDERYFLRDE